MALQTMKDLFVQSVQDLYYAEKRIVEALPRMADVAEAPELADAFRHHLEETRGQVDRLEEVFANCDEAVKGRACPAIDGIIAETKGIMEEARDGQVLDAALLAGAQAIEHYEIARYASLCGWAKLLGDDASLELLKETLSEEKDADLKLSRIAEQEVNRRAVG